jgi:hypothetical protein
MGNVDFIKNCQEGCHHFKIKCFPNFHISKLQCHRIFSSIEYNIKNLVPQMTMWLIKRSNIA